MANQLSKGTVFVDGQVVNAATLNNLVDLATALEGIISAQGAPVTPVGTDQVLLLRPGTPNTLKRGNVSLLPASISSFAMTSNSAVIQVGVFNPTGPAVDVVLDLNPEDPYTFLAGPNIGTTSARPFFRKILPVDTSNFTIVPAWAIDTYQSSTFYKQLHASGTLTLFNGTAGQVIKVITEQLDTALWTVAWGADSGGTIAWPGGAPPVVTTGLGLVDMFEFTCTGSNNWLGLRTGARFF